MRTFEDFRDRVLRGLQEWDKKAVELSELGAKYYSEIEEQRRIFVSMRQIIKDKDNLISQLQ